MVSIPAMLKGENPADPPMQLARSSTLTSSISAPPDEPALIAAALVVCLIIGMLYERFLHPLGTISTPQSAGIGALPVLRPDPRTSR
jgi:multidrug efflux pump subunit AcrB